MVTGTICPYRRPNLLRSLLPGVPAGRGRQCTCCRPMSDTCVWPEPSVLPAVRFARDGCLHRRQTFGAYTDASNRKWRLPEGYGRLRRCAADACVDVRVRSAGAYPARFGRLCRHDQGACREGRLQMSICKQRTSADVSRRSSKQTGICRSSADD